MYTTMLAAIALYVVLLAIEFAAQYFGATRRPWSFLRGLSGTVGVLAFTFMVSSWVGLNPSKYFPRLTGNAVASIQTSSLGLGKIDSSLPAPKRRTGPDYGSDDLSTSNTSQHPDIYRYIHYYSALYRVDPLLVKVVIRVESGFDPYAVSGKGAMGLMQINKITQKHLGIENPFDVRQNIEGGTRYLKNLLKKHYWDIGLALASYNAGPTAVSRYKGVPPFQETRRYIWRVLSEYRKLKRLAKVFRESEPRAKRDLSPRQPQAFKTKANSSQNAG
mgnify:FL=1